MVRAPEGMFGSPSDVPREPRKQQNRFARRGSQSRPGRRSSLSPKQARQLRESAEALQQQHHEKLKSEQHCTASRLRRRETIGEARPAALIFEDGEERAVFGTKRSSIDIEQMYKTKCTQAESKLIHYISPNKEKEFRPFGSKQIIERLGAISDINDRGSAGVNDQDALREQELFLTEERSRECKALHVIAGKLRESFVKHVWMRSSIEVGILETWLASFALFSGLAKSSRTRVARACHLLALNRGEYLYQSGDSNVGGLYIVLQGAIDLFESSADAGSVSIKEECKLTTLYAGDAVGQRALLRPDQTREHSARAESSSIVLQLSLPAFQHLKATESHVHRVFLEALEAAQVYSGITTNDDALKTYRRAHCSLLASQSRLLQLLPAAEVEKLCAEADILEIPPGGRFEARGITLLIKGTIQVSTEMPKEWRYNTTEKPSLDRIRQYFVEEDLWWRQVLKNTRHRPAPSGSSTVSALLSSEDLEGVCQARSSHGYSDDEISDEEDDLLERTESLRGPSVALGQHQRSQMKFASMRVPQAVNLQPSSMLKPPQNVPGALREGFIKHVKAQHRRRSTHPQVIEEGAENFMQKFRKSTIAALGSRASQKWKDYANGILFVCELEYGTVLEDETEDSVQQDNHCCGTRDVEQEYESELNGYRFQADKLSGCQLLCISPEAIRQAFGRKKVKRQATSRRLQAVPIGHLFAQPPHARTEDDIMQIAYRMRSLASLVQLPPSSRLELCRRAKLETFKTGEIVVVQGDTRAEKYYIVLCGSLSILKHPNAGVPKRVGNFRESFGSCFMLLKPGDAFGEAAMLRKAGRSASVIAREPSCLLSISYSDYARMLCLNLDGKEGKLRNHAEISDEIIECLNCDPSLRSSEDIGMLVEWTSKLEFFQSINMRGRRLLCSTLRYACFEATELIFAQGSDANTAYIVISGGVSIHKTERPLPPASGSMKGKIKGEFADFSVLGACVDVAATGELVWEANPREMGRARPGATPEWFHITSGVARGRTEVCIVDESVIRRLLSENQTTILPDLIKEVVHKIPSQRSFQESQLLENLLVRVSFLKQLAYESNILQRISQALKCIRVPASEVIFEQGDDGDFLYIILRGSIHIRQQKEFGDTTIPRVVDFRSVPRMASKRRLNKAQCVADLRAGKIFPDRDDYNRILNFHFGEIKAELHIGDSFGEMALFPDNNQRSGTAITVEPCLLLTINRNDFEDTLRRHLKTLVFQPTLAKQKLADHTTLSLGDHIRGIRSVLESMEICRELQAFGGDDRINAVCERLEYMVLSPGQILAHKGDKVTKMYIVVKGVLQETIGGEEAEAEVIRYKGGDTALESALALKIPQHATLKSVGRSVVLSLSGYWYRKLWPKDQRLRGKLRILQQSAIFAQAYPRELASLIHIMTLEKFQRNVEIDCTGRVILIREGACEVHSREHSEVVLAELGVGEMFGEGYSCGHEKFVRQLAQERLITKCQSEAYVFPADQLAAVLTQTTLNIMVTMACVKHAWHLAYLSRQASVSRKSSHAKAQLQLRAAILDQIRSHGLKPTNNTQTTTGKNSTHAKDNVALDTRDVELPNPSSSTFHQIRKAVNVDIRSLAQVRQAPTQSEDDMLVRSRYPGNPFQGEMWLQVHKAGIPVHSLVQSSQLTASRAGAEKRVARLSSGVPMMSCFGQKLAKSSISKGQKVDTELIKSPKHKGKGDFNLK